MSRPKISLIVPVYKVEKYLDKCLKSLVDQTFQEIEILVINDGSQAIIDRYAASYPHLIKAFKKSNGGLGDARNYGLKQAKGVYLMFVDSDNWVEPSLCGEMYALITKHDADMGVFNFICEDENGSPVRAFDFIAHSDECIDVKKNFSIFNELSPCAWNKMFKTEFFREIKFPTGIYYEDITTLIAFLKADQLVKTNKLYYHYIKRSNSITNTIFGRKHLLDFYHCQNLLIQAFNKSKYQNHKDRLHFYLIRKGGAPHPYSTLIRDPKVLKECFEKAKQFRREHKLPMFRFFFYKRSDGTNHFLNWSLKYKLYYILAIFSPWFLEKILLAKIYILKKIRI